MKLHVQAANIRDEIDTNQEIRIFSLAKIKIFNKISTNIVEKKLKYFKIFSDTLKTVGFKKEALLDGQGLPNQLLTYYKPERTNYEKNYSSF